MSHIGSLQRRCFDECEVAGWDPDRRLSFAEEIAHLHEEVSEAFRAYRERLDFAITYREDGKPEGVPIEFADVLIGLFYNAELHGFDLVGAFEIKHAWNLSRSYELEGRQLHRSKPTPLGGFDTRLNATGPARAASTVELGERSQPTEDET